MQRNVQVPVYRVWAEGRGHYFSSIQKAERFIESQYKYFPVEEYGTLDIDKYLIAVDLDNLSQTICDLCVNRDLLH